VHDLEKYSTFCNGVPFVAFVFVFPPAALLQALLLQSRATNAVLATVTDITNFVFHFYKFICGSEISSFASDLRDPSFRAV
jgi:hypothetical protein